MRIRVDARFRRRRSAGPEGELGMRRRDERRAPVRFRSVRSGPEQDSAHDRVRRGPPRFPHRVRRSPSDRDPTEDSGWEERRGGVKSQEEVSGRCSCPVMAGGNVAWARRWICCHAPRLLFENSFFFYGSKAVGTFVFYVHLS